MKTKLKGKALVATFFLLAMSITPLAAHADINVGVILSLTGPGASMGIPANEATRMWPDKMAGHKVNVTVLNDSTDATTAAKNASKLINEHKVDVIIGSSLTPPSLAILEVAAQNQTPLISLAGGGAIVDPVTGSRVWAFKLSPPERFSVKKILDHMQSNKQTTLGAIAIATSYGEGFLKELQKQSEGYGIKVLNIERYNQTDQSVTAQIAKILSNSPDAVFVISAGTPGALPQIEMTRRGYKGAVYQTQGIANNDFLRVGGKDVEGTFVTVAPVLVAEQLPEADPIRKPALEFLQQFEGKNGPNSRSLFAASSWDAYLLLQKAAENAVKSAQPGTPEFRAALRTSIEKVKDFVTAEAVYSFSDKDHNGVDERSQVLVRIENGRWKLVK